MATIGKLTPDQIKVLETVLTSIKRERTEDDEPDEEQVIVKKNITVGNNEDEICKNLSFILRDIIKDGEVTKKKSSVKGLLLFEAIVEYPNEFSLDLMKQLLPPNFKNVVRIICEETGKPKSMRILIYYTEDSSLQVYYNMQDEKEAAIRQNNKKMIEQESAADFVYFHVDSNVDMLKVKGKPGIECVSKASEAGVIVLTFSVLLAGPIKSNQMLRVDASMGARCRNLLTSPSNDSENIVLYMEIFSIPEVKIAEKTMQASS